MCKPACVIGKKHREAVELSSRSNGAFYEHDDLLSTLMRAALIGDTGAIIDLVARGVDINAPDRYGRTALMEAIYADHTDAVETLLKLGADVNARDDNGWTPLMEAASKGRSCAVEILLAYGAAANAVCKNGRTALKVAPRTSTEIKRRLKQAAAKT